MSILLPIIYRVASSHVSKDGELSENLLDRLSGFLEEVGRLSDEILSNSGSGSIWKDRKDGRSEVVKSAVDSLKHLSSEFDSLSKFISRTYHDKTVATTITNLVNSLNGLFKSTSGMKKLFGGPDDYIEALRERHEEVATRLRACRSALDRLRTKSESLDDFDFGPK